MRQTIERQLEKARWGKAGRQGYRWRLIECGMAERRNVQVQSMRQRAWGWDRLANELVL